MIRRETTITDFLIRRTIIMKIIVLLSFMIVQICSKPQGTSKQLGVIDTILSAPSRICLCRCGIPNREMRSVEDEVERPFERSPKAKGQTKLIGGDVPSTHVFPWLVLVMAKGEVVAGGALISDNHILTSASPISKEVAYDVKVRVAVHDRCVGDITSSNISIEAIILHPAYSPASRAHDIALLKLSSQLRFDRRIYPICLPNSRLTYNGEVATVVSWLAPTVKTDDPARCEPHRLRQPILPDVDCSRAITSSELLTPDKACIGVVGSKSLFCGGDVGAPLQWMTQNGRYELIGILTDINVCDQTNSTLYIKVTDHLSWINQVVANDCLCRI